MVGKAWQQAHEAAGRIVAAVRRQTETSAGAQPTSPFHSARDLSLWGGVLPTVRVGLPVLVESFRKHPHRYPTGALPW